MLRHYFIVFILLSFANPSALFALDDKPQNRQTTQKNADVFSSQLLKISIIFEEEHITKPSRHRMLVWAVESLFQKINVKIPNDIRNALNKSESHGPREWDRLLKKIRVRLGAHKAIQGEKGLDVAIQGILDRIEPGFKHPTQKSLREFRLVLNRGRLGPPKSVGLIFEQDGESKMLRVLSTVPNSPAHKAGIKPGDLVSHICYTSNLDQGHFLEKQVISTTTLTSRWANYRLEGTEGTPVEIIVLRPSTKKPITFSLKRTLVNNETLLGWKRKADYSWEYTIPTHPRIGYIRITRFTGDSPEQLAQVLQKLKAGQCQGVILDLRKTNERYTLSAYKSANLFIKKGMYAKYYSRDRVREMHFKDLKVKIQFLYMPIVCLIDEGTIGRMEAFAACLQDNQRAWLIGSRTPGDVGLQYCLPWKREGRLFVTGVVCQRINGQQYARLLVPAEKAGVSPHEGLSVPLCLKEKELVRMQLRNLPVIGLPKSQVYPRTMDRQVAKAVLILEAGIRIN